MLLLPLCAVLLVFPALTTAQCEPQLTVQHLLTQDAGGAEQTAFAPGETIRFVAEVNNGYGGYMLGSNGTELAITTSFYSATNPVDIPPGISTWTWEATTPSEAGDYTVEVRVYDHFCGISGGLGRNFSVTGQEGTPPPEAQPAITLDPTEGPAGTQVTVTGSGWIPGDTVYIHFTVAGNEVAQATVGDDGSFTTTFTVPSDAEIGEQLVIAGNLDVSWQTDAPFQVTNGEAETDLVANAGPDQTVPGPSPVAVQFDGSGSTGDIVSYKWYNQWGLLLAEGATPVIEVNFGYEDPQPGTQRTFTLVVEDSQGNTAQDQVTITLGETEAADTEPPTVSWVKPVGTEQVYIATSASETIELEATVTDNVGLGGVSFARWDRVNQQWVEIATFSAPPYQARVEVSTLNMSWNEILAGAIDTAGNQTVARMIISRAEATHAIQFYLHTYYDPEYPCFSDSEGSDNLCPELNEQLSSIVLQPRWSVRLFKDPNQAGASKCFTASDEDLGNDQFDDGTPVSDQVSSFTLYQQSECGSPPEETPLP
jgi:hypothetical protein